MYYRWVRVFEWGYWVRAGISDRVIDTPAKSLYLTFSTCSACLFTKCVPYYLSRGTMPLFNTLHSFPMRISHSTSYYARLLSYVTSVRMVTSVTWLLRASPDLLPRILRNTEPNYFHFVVAFFYNTSRQLFSVYLHAWKRSLTAPPGYTSLLT